MPGTEQGLGNRVLTDTPQGLECTLCALGHQEGWGILTVGLEGLYGGNHDKQGLEACIYHQ